MASTGVQVYRDLFGTIHDWMEGTLEDLTDEQAHWQPPGSALPAAAQYLHHLTGEDIYINQMFQNKAPLFETEWAECTGASSLPPRYGWEQWARTVKIDLEQARSYAQAVYTSTDEFIAGISDNDLARIYDFTSIGWGKFPLSYLLSQLIADGGAHTGEISCIKGLQGAKGYPF
jgi:hypothetical protein